MSKVAVGIAVIIVLCAGWDLAARLSNIVIGIGQAQAQVEIEPLNDLEKMLVNYALQRLEGKFIVNRLAQALVGQGISHHQVQKVAEQFERRSWLTKPQYATDARRNTPVQAF